MREPIKGKTGSITSYEDENWNREGNRGASVESLQVGDGGHAIKNSKVSYFGASDGSNNDTYKRPVDKGHAKPTL